jgi:hypothetical protein
VHEVWGDIYLEGRAYLSLYIHYLRQKLEDDVEHPRYIYTEWGVGYWFTRMDGVYQEPLELGGYLRDVCPYSRGRHAYKRNAHCICVLDEGQFTVITRCHTLVEFQRFPTLTDPFLTRAGFPVTSA